MKIETSWSSGSDIEINEIYGQSRYPKNTTLFWCELDNEKNFEKNLQDPAKSLILREHNWNKESIQYRFNNHGFRTDDDWDAGYSERYGNMFIGASSTLGIGLNIESTWGYKIASLLGGRFYNLSQSGAGIETQYRLLKAWAPILKPKRIFTLGSYEPRREFFTDRQCPTIISSWSNETILKHLMPLITPEEEIKISIIRTLDAMINVAKSYGAELWVAKHRFLRMAYEADPCTTARDTMHHGEKWHTALAATVDDWKRLA